MVVEANLPHVHHSPPLTITTKATRLNFWFRVQNNSAYITEGVVWRDSVGGIVIVRWEGESARGNCGRE